MPLHPSGDAASAPGTATAHVDQQPSIDQATAIRAPQRVGMLCTIGDVLEDVVVWLHSAIAPGTDTPARIERRRGGSAANVAAFAANVSGAARLIANLGSDDAGERLLASLEFDGVQVSGTRKGRTGTVIALVDQTGERSMLTDRGDADLLTDPNPTWLDGVAWLHIPAYSLFGAPLSATVDAVAGEARRRSVPVSVDLSSVALIDHVGREPFLERVASIRPDLVFANLDEYRTISPAPAGFPWIVKAGREPAIVRNADGSVLSVPAQAVAHVRDSTGAGDAFAAGTIVAIIAGAPIADAVVQGHALAARVLQQPGAALQGRGPDGVQRRATMDL